MALQGTLKDFSITDIFQLITQQGKTGTLIIITEAAETQIAFDKGAVVMARFTKGHEDTRLGTMLERAQALAPEQLAVALDEHEKQMKSLGDVLLAKDYLTKETLSEFLHLQTRETLFRVLQWKNGAYKFKSEAFNYNKQIIKPLSSDFLLMDGVRQLDEWPELQKIVGPPGNLFELTANGQLALLEGPGGNNGNQSPSDDDIDSAFAAFDQKSDGASAAKPKVTEAERTILKLVQEQLPLQRIIDRSRLGSFEAVSTLAQLVRNALVLASSQAGSGAPVSAVYKKTSMSSARYSFIGLCVMGMAGLVAGALLSYVKPLIMNDQLGLVASENEFVQRSQFKQYQIACGERRLRQALAIYHIESLDYPNDLNQLALTEILPASEINGPKALQYYYRKDLNGYLLLPPQNGYDPY